MKSMTYEEFLEFEPCWLENDKKSAKLQEIGRRRERWTALDILDLPVEEVRSVDKLWAVLREEFIDGPVLHEFACRCAEKALKLVEHPDPRSIAAIEAKRRWLRGEIGDHELDDAMAASANACAATHAASVAAWAAHAAASAASAASADAWNAARAAASAARAAAWDACAAAWDAARTARAAWDDQAAMLRWMLGAAGGSCRAEANGCACCTDEVREWKGKP